MQHPACVEMPTDWNRVEGNKHDVIQLVWNQGQARLQIAATDRLAKDEHFILDRDKGLVQRSVEVVIDLGEYLSVDWGMLSASSRTAHNLLSLA